MSKDVQINSEALDDFLKNDLGDFLASTKSIDNTVKEMSVAKSKGELSSTDIEQGLASFLEQGSSVLDTMTIYCNNMPDAESVNAFASLINSLTRALNQIANLYKTEQTHKNRMELEEKKHELKLKEIEFKERIKATKQTGDPGLIEEGEDMVEVSTTDIVNQLIDGKNRTN